MCHAIRLRHLTAIVLTVLTFLVTALFSQGATFATTAGPMPIVNAVSAERPDIVRVVGEHFTPGGRVYIGVFDRSGSMPEEVLHRAQQTVARGRNGSLDPAAEPSEVGAFGAVAGQWVSASESIYGRNGGLDPATRYFAGGAVIAEFTIPCDSPSAVRAFDQSTSVWSNWIDSRSEC